jgi:hypothetical protein
VGTCLFAKALVTNGCVYLLIKNLLPSSRRCFDVFSPSLSSNGSTRYSTTKFCTEAPLVCNCYPLNYLKIDDSNILFILAQIIGYAAQSLRSGLAKSRRICITGMPLKKRGDGV